MDKIEKIRQKIEELYDGEAPKHDQQCDFSDGYFTGLSVISNFLDTLTEEPDKSMEEAAYKYSFDSRPSIYGQVDVIDAFKAGAEWQARQLLQGSPMPEDTVLFNNGVAEGRRLEREDMLKDAVEADVNTYKDPVLSCGWAEFVVDMPSSETDKFGNKVRIIVLKAEEE